MIGKNMNSQRISFLSLVNEGNKEFGTQGHVLVTASKSFLENIFDSLIEDLERKRQSKVLHGYYLRTGIWS